MNVVELYAHRQGSDSFKVGQRTDFCAAAYALSCGVNFETFKRARADVTLDRPQRCERKRQRTARVEASVAQVRGYINAPRSCCQWTPTWPEARCKYVHGYAVINNNISARNGAVTRSTRRIQLGEPRGINIPSPTPMQTLINRRELIINDA